MVERLKAQLDDLRNQAKAHWQGLVVLADADYAKLMKDIESVKVQIAAALKKL